MPSKGTKKLPPAKRAKIAAEKELGHKTGSQIARDYKVSPATVSLISYDSLSPKAKELYHKEMQALPYRSADIIMDSMDALKMSIAEAKENPSAKNISALASAAKTAHEIHLKATGQADVTIEHRSPADTARAALARAMASGMFTRDQLDEVRDVVAKRYGVDRKLLEE